MKPLANYNEDKYDAWQSRVYWLRNGRSNPGQPFLFLDRDGVLNEDTGYVGRVSEVKLLPGVAEVIRFCRSVDLAVCLVTNQSGIGRGFYSWSDFEAVCAHIGNLIATDEPIFEAIAACAQVPTGDALASTSWRKPCPGMIDKICERLQVHRKRSWLVGDRQSDVEAAAGAGLAGAIYVSDQPSPDLTSANFFHCRVATAAAGIASAAKYILQNENC